MLYTNGLDWMKTLGEQLCLYFNLLPTTTAPDKMPVEFQSDTIITTSNVVAFRLHKIYRYTPSE